MYKRLFLIIALINISLYLFSQNNFKSDKQIITENTFEVHTYDKRNVDFGFKNKNKFNPIKIIFSSLMFAYQSVLSPQLSAQCLYNPTCSNYSKELIKRYGLIKGIIFTSDRLMRCNRISGVDFDPVFINQKTLKYDDNVEVYSLH